MATMAFVGRNGNNVDTTQEEFAKLSGVDLYQILMDRLVDHLTDEVPRKRRPRYITIDGNEILCETREDAVALADFLEEVCGIPVHIGFYDPKDDEANDEVDICTGKWCVYVD